MEFKSKYVSLMTARYDISVVDRVRQRVSICSRMSISVPKCKYGACLLNRLILTGEHNCKGEIRRTMQVLWQRPWEREMDH